MKPPAPGESAPPDSTRALEWARAHGAVDEVFARVEARLRARRRRRLATAATLAVAIAVGALWWRPTPATIALPAATSLAVAVAGPRQQTLPDGTLVELREGAQLSVASTENVRRVVLERGEAHFAVAKNPARPFVVAAGGVDVRAVGTAFAVQLGAQAVEVIVTEGRVAVEKPVPTTAAAAAPAPAVEFASVGAGNRVVVDLARPPAPAPVVAVSPAELDDRLAWRVPRLELAATPLAQAVAFFNQHSPRRLVLADPELGRLELSGSIRADNVEPLLRLLRTEFAIEADRRPGVIVLRRRR